MPNHKQQNYAADVFDDWLLVFEGVTGTAFRASERNLWWQPEGNGESVMFSLRNDGNWRPFPGPADGPSLRFDKKPRKVLGMGRQPQRRTN